MPERALPTLRQVRQQHHLSIRRLATRTGVHRTTIWRYEQGRSHPLPVIRQMFALVLGYAPEQIAWKKGTDDAFSQS